MDARAVDDTGSVHEGNTQFFLFAIDRAASNASLYTSTVSQKPDASRPSKDSRNSCRVKRSIARASRSAAIVPIGLTPNI